ncbi:MAG TPA: hypothetical protein VEY10_11545 [Flavisolibacter sp.]|jgi:hypothetical protein|nr:hypothetical protein [Flavisolibacter sp.]
MHKPGKNTWDKAENKLDKKEDTGDRRGNHRDRRKMYVMHNMMANAGLA